MKTMKEALFSSKNITKIKNIQEVIKDGGCILIHNHENDEEIIIYNTYDGETLEFSKSNISDRWVVRKGYNDKFDVKEYISNECDLYTIEGYNDERQWLYLRNIFFVILSKPLSFKPIEYIIRALKKYNMKLQPIAY